MFVLGWAYQQQERCVRTTCLIVCSLTCMLYRSTKAIVVYDDVFNVQHVQNARQIPLRKATSCKALNGIASDCDYSPAWNSPTVEC